MASSLKGESSYSYLTDFDTGLSLVDRFTFATLRFFERVGPHSEATLADLFGVYRCGAVCCVRCVLCAVCCALCAVCCVCSADGVGGRRAEGRGALGCGARAARFFS